MSRSGADAPDDLCDQLPIEEEVRQIRGTAHAPTGVPAQIEDQAVELAELRDLLAEFRGRRGTEHLDVRVADCALEQTCLDARNEDFAPGDRDLQLLLGTHHVQGDGRVDLSPDLTDRFAQAERSGRLAIDRHDPVPLREPSTFGGTIGEDRNGREVAVASSDARADPVELPGEADREVLGRSARKHGRVGIEREQGALQSGELEVLGVVEILIEIRVDEVERTSQRRAEAADVDLVVDRDRGLGRVT